MCQEAAAATYDEDPVLKGGIPESQGLEEHGQLLVLRIHRLHVVLSYGVVDYPEKDKHLLLVEHYQSEGHSRDSTGPHQVRPY